MDADHQLGIMPVRKILDRPGNPFFHAPAEDLPAKGQAVDSPKVAIVTWDSAFGRGALTDETKAYAEKLGIKIMTQEFFGMGAPDVTTQILAAKKAGANVIYTNTLAHGPAQILKDAVSLGVLDRRRPEPVPSARRRSRTSAAAPGPARRVC